MRTEYSVASFRSKYAFPGNALKNIKMINLWHLFNDYNTNTETRSFSI